MTQRLFITIYISILLLDILTITHFFNRRDTQNKTIMQKIGVCLFILFGVCIFKYQVDPPSFEGALNQISFGTNIGISYFMNPFKLESFSIAFPVGLSLYWIRMAYKTLDQRNLFKSTLKGQDSN